MSCEIIFNPNTDAFRWEEESNVKISAKVNAPATATIVLPNTETTRQLDGNAEIRLNYGGRILFDGQCQKKEYGRDTITLTAYDKLWLFDRIRRSFDQTTDDITASQAFTNAFDQNETFSDFTSAITYYETYALPFIGGYNATTFVVPCDPETTYSDFFNLANGSGMKFMDQLAAAGHYRDIYNYFYWYEYNGGEQCLCFQPEGWGQLWEYLQNCTLTAPLIECFENLWNNIVVWGTHRNGMLPTDGDMWTEKDLEGWSTYPFVDLTLDTTDEQVGTCNLRVDINNVGAADYYFERNYENSPLNLETMTLFHFWYKVSTTDFDRVGIALYDSGGLTKTHDHIPADVNWHEESWTKADFVGGDAAFDWTDIVSISIHMRGAAGIGADETVDWDGLYITTDACRSENDTLSNGYHSNSITNYGERHVSIIQQRLFNIASCNALASNLVSYYGEPEYTMSLSMPYMWNGHLNDRVKDNWYGTDRTLPVTAITWNFENQQITTDVSLGVKRLTLEELLKKLYDNVESAQYDGGLQYYVN